MLVFSYSSAKVQNYYESKAVFEEKDKINVELFGM